ncbi:MAG: DUF4276 family protein [Candidatus Hatepunaea meridiana]|nr:DUF4276 family protein [Candidatus Hatepunaea meridiana]
MKITLIVEGKTEKAFLPYLRGFLEARLQGNMPKIDVNPYDGRIPTQKKLKRIVHNLLSGKKPSDHVIALTDVYTGSQPPDFTDASDARNKMRQWVGEEQRFHSHAAQYDFEAWLLPYWEDIQRLAGHNRVAPKGNPEQVNHNNPPSYRIKEIFRTGSKSRAYIKPRDAGRILRDNDLSISISHCAELKSFVNTILKAHLPPEFHLSL